MAEAFNKYFSSTFTHAPEIPLDAFTPLDEGMAVLDSLVLCEDEVYKLLLNSNPSKAPGPGGPPTIVLKSCARELTPSLFSLAAGKLLTEWKDALVVLVHNKGKKEDVTNYRPISLLCVVSKVLERCIFKYFEEFLCPLFHNVKIPVLGMSYDTHGIFYIPVNFAFNLPNYVTSYMHCSGKKKKKIRLRKICFQGIQTRSLQSVRTETLLSTSIFSEKSIFNAALCRFKYFD